MADFVIREADVLERQATHLVGTLGHVSEGKSTLIRALTGVKTQRHAAEQERNITIHLGYANCRVYQNAETGELRASAAPPDPAGWTLIAHISFVDCPGHEAYLATMLGGAAVMDSACLIVAANQEVVPQPQTLEHLIAAEIMGLERLAIVQNKLDLLPGPAEGMVSYDKIRAFTAESVAETAPVFPVSAQHGWGVHHVLKFLTSLPPPERHLNGPARLTCVRSFDVNRPGPVGPTTELRGAVIGGTLQQGVLAVGDWIELRPGVLRRGADGAIVAQPIVTRVRGLRCDTTELPYAVPGSLIAIATDLDPGLSTANGMIGQRVGTPGSLPPICGAIVVRVHKIKRDSFTFGKQRIGDRVRVCSNVMTTEGVITGIDDKRRVSIALDRPLCVEVGERVSLLRFHPEAGRELLEGAGDVRGVTEWPNVLLAVGAEEAVAPTRRIVWEPIDRSSRGSEEAAPTYPDLLAAVFAKKGELGAASRFQLPEPIVKRVNRDNFWVNWTQTVAALDAGEFGPIRYADHLLAFMLGDLQTTGSINAQGQLLFAGRWRQEDIRNLLQRYCATYKRCGPCGGYDTGLVRVGQTTKLRCTRCATDHVIGT
jgi:translation initiation factor 2 subunit 3